MNISISMQCLRLKGFRTSYLRSKKYMTSIKALYNEASQCDIAKWWIRQIGIRYLSSKDCLSINGTSAYLFQNKYEKNGFLHCEDKRLFIENKRLDIDNKDVVIEDCWNIEEDPLSMSRPRLISGTKGSKYDSICSEHYISFHHTRNRSCVKCLHSMNSDRIQTLNKSKIPKTEIQQYYHVYRFQKQYPCCEHKCFSHGHKKLFHSLVNRTIPTTQLFSCRCIHTTSVLHVEQRESEWKARTVPPWRVLFFGTDQISVETLKRLHENMHSSYSVVDSLEVVSNVEQREVRSYALEQGLKIYDWPVPAMPNKYDVGVLVSFGHLIPDDIIHMFPYGILNMHPSLLPRWRGASPIIHTILNGDPETGISIMEIRPKRFDVGPVLMQRRFPVPTRCTSLQLSSILAPIGADMIIECLADLRTLERFEEEQDSTGVRYAHKLVKKNAYVDWTNQTCEDIDQQFRAISEVMPLRSEWREHKVKLFDMVDPDLTRKLELQLVRGYKGDITRAAPGTPAYHKKLNCVLIKCKDGVVGFRTLSVKKHMTAKEFLGGYLTPPDGSVFQSLENDLNKYVKKKRVKQRAKV